MSLSPSVPPSVSPSIAPQAIADLRINYSRQSLNEADVQADPLQQFRQWFEQAQAAQVPEPNAMTLATVAPDGSPSARIVLLKGLDDRGFVFFTNYDSAKGQALAVHPQAALVFLWHELERQVRVEGRVEKIADAETEAYFHSRPEASQLGAWASPQSQVIAGHQVLEDNFAALRDRYSGQPIPRPPHWGGYRVIPTRIEFWQGRPSRLHDRLNYRFDETGQWAMERLAP